MIYTVTFNPAIDLVVDGDIEVGKLNRASSESYRIGGKGILISLMSKVLGHKTFATGFIGGFTGNYIKDELNRLKINNYLIEASGTTRVNLKLVSDEDDLTQINMTGVKVNNTQFNLLKDYLKEHLEKDDFLILSGIPNDGLSIEKFEKLCSIGAKAKAKLIFDTSMEYSKVGLKYEPWLVRPSIFELNQVLLRSKHSKEEDMVNEAKKLNKMGAKNVLLVNGEDGTILVNKDGLYYGYPTEREMNYLMGVGEAFIAGLIAGMIEGLDFNEANKLAIACYSAFGVSEDILNINKKDCMKMLKEVDIRFKGASFR